MSQTVITVYEDRKKHVHLTDSQKADILSFRTIFGGNHIHLDYDGTLQVMKYVGFISKGDTRLQILPKIFEKQEASTKGSSDSPFNLAMYRHLKRFVFTIIIFRLLV